MNELGNFLKKIRKDRKESLRTASNAIGISHTYLDSLEKGFDPRTKKVRKPNPDVLKKISDYYNVAYVTLLAKANYYDEKFIPLRVALEDEEYRKKFNTDMKELFKEFSGSFKNGYKNFNKQTIENVNNKLISLTQVELSYMEYHFLNNTLLYLTDDEVTDDHLSFMSWIFLTLYRNINIAKHEDASIDEVNKDIEDISKHFSLYLKYHYGVIDDLERELKDLEDKP